MEDRKEKLTDVIELIVVVFLGITSVFGAFAAYQASLNNSAMAKEYNQGIATITDANSYYIEAGQTYASDQSLYQSLLSLPSSA